MSLALECSLQDACGTPGGEAQWAVGDRVLEPEKESVTEDRQLGILGIQLGVEVVKQMRLHMESAGHGQRREQRAKPAFKGLWQMPSETSGVTSAQHSLFPMHQ